MHRLSLLSLKFPVLAVCVVVALSIGAGAGILRLQFDDGMRTAFAGASEEYRHYEENRSRFTESDIDIAVLFRSSGFADPARLEAVRDFALEANFASHVGETFSLFSLLAPPDENGDMAALLPADLFKATDLDAQLTGLRTHPLGGDRLVSADLDLTMVLVSQLTEHSGVEPSRETLADLHQMAAEAVVGKDITFSIAGLAPVRQIIIDGLLRDTIVLNAIGIFIGLVICLIAIGSPKLALLTIVPPTFALLWVLGAMGWLGLNINTVTNAVPVLILVLSFADSLHLTYEVRRQLTTDNPDKGREQEPNRFASAIEVATQRVGPACAMTSFTTAIAFAALLISDSELVRSLGWSGSVATLVSLVAVLCTHPLTFLFATRLPAFSEIFGRKHAGQFSLFQGEAFYRFGFRAHRKITITAVVGLVLAMAVYSTIKPIYSFLENIEKSNPALIAMQELERELVPTGSIDISVELPKGVALSRQTIEDIRLVHETIEAEAPDSLVTSIATLARWVEGKDEEPDLAEIESALDQMSDLQRGRFLSRDGSAALVRLYVSDKGSRATRDLVAKLEQAVALTGLAARIGAPTGLLAMSAQVSMRMIDHLNISFVIAVAASGLFIALWFGNWRYGLVSLVPNILPIACVGAWLAMTGWGLQFSSAIALTIAFGIAVDDTIHVINRLRLEASGNDPFDHQAIRRVYADIAPILTITTAVLSFGMLGTQMSSIPTIAYFGALVIAVFILALLAVLVILPACLFTLGKPDIAENQKAPDEPEYLAKLDTE